MPFPAVFLLLGSILVPAPWRASASRQEASGLEPSTAPGGSLELLGSVHFAVLGGDGPSIQGIDRFDLDEHGRIGLVRWMLEDDWGFELIDPESGESRSIALPSSGAEDDHGAEDHCLTWIADSRWLLVRQPESGLSSASWIDVEHGTVTRVEPWPFDSVLGVARFAVGGWIVLGSLGKTLGIHACDASGRVVWSATSDRDAPFRDPQNVAYGAGEVWLAEEGGLVRVFDEAGSPLRRVKTDTRMAGPSAGIEALLDGRFLLSGRPSARIVARDGTLSPFFEPHHPDGNRLAFWSIEAAPDGSLWTHDLASRWHPGGAFYRLDETGLAQRAFGPAFDPERLTAPERVTLDTLGRVLIADARTGVVHVFEPDGRALFRCRLLPEDFGRHEFVQHLGALGDGGVFVHRSSGVVRFDREGRRVGRDTYRGDDHPLPGRGLFWRTSRNLLQLIDEHGKREVRVRNAPRGPKLQDVRAVAVSPAGALAALDFGGLSEPGPWVHVYSPLGEPMRSIEVPSTERSLAFDGERIGIRAADEIFLFSAGGEPLGRGRLPLQAEEGWPLFFSPDGDELWLFDAGGVMHRLGLPR